MDIGAPDTFTNWYYTANTAPYSLDILLDITTRIRGRYLIPAPFMAKR